MASTNPDSMTNAQGEFHPSKPGDEPLQTSGHQPGRQVGNDAAPEFSAQVLPAGSAPASKTFQPNPVDETPGQANNDLAGRSHDKEDTKTGPLDMPGATSADVHAGHGHPGQGQTSSEIRHEGKSGRDRERLGRTGQAEGGTGIQGEESNEIKRLQQDHQPGHVTEKEHNVSLDGAESKQPVAAEQLANETGKV